jgi:hypothetical protein
MIILLYCIVLYWLLMYEYLHYHLCLQIEQNSSILFSRLEYATFYAQQ